jgi:hypothetical protein
MENAEERRIAKDGRFDFEDQDLGPGTHVYDNVCRDEDGHTARLPAGEKYATFVSTVDPQRLHVCDARGRYLGWCERTFIPTRGDAEGFARAAGRKMQAHRELLAPVLEAARPIMKRMTDDAAVNDVIFAEAQGAPDEKPARPTRSENKSNARRAAQLAAAAEQQISADPL